MVPNILWQVLLRYIPVGKDTSRLKDVDTAKHEDGAD